MTIGLRLDLRQTQQLVMTPQLQQAIRLLAMSHLELAEFVAGEVERNPLLALEDASEAPEVPPESDSVSAATDGVGRDMDLMRRTFDTGSENLVDSSPSDGPSPLGTSRTKGPSSVAMPVEDRLTGAPSIRAHLLAELPQVGGGTPTERRLAIYLSGEVDDDGYLRTPLAELAELAGATVEQMEGALQLIQRCSPTGIGARDLAECFRLQLAERGHLDPMISCFLSNMRLVAEGKIRRLQSICEASEEDVAEMLAELRTLDPRPAARLAATEAETLVPDILLSRGQWGGWQVELNSDTLPRIIMDNDYRALLGGRESDETRLFLGDCQARAGWLLKSLDQRARTILKVATQIVRRQQAFLDDGVAALRPMTLREVADAVNIHESTASRVTSNKFIATPHGVLELKYFFTNAVGAGESATSATSVRHRIRELVAGENVTGVLSDDAIVRKLGEEGIDIARRTVAKYRKSLNIPSSSQRRRAIALTGLR